MTSMATSFATTYLTKGDSAAMQTLDDLWYLAFGRISKLAELQKLKDEADNEASLILYKNSIAQRLLGIHENFLQVPPVSIVGPALEASKYYIEEEELREMFVNVITSSMDRRKSEEVHHSFVEIIKQLSPRDAKNLSLFSLRGGYPIVRYISENKLNKSFWIIESLVFLPDEDNNFVDKLDSASISNLVRLGLLNVSFTESYNNNEKYKKYYNEDDRFYQIRRNRVNDDSNFILHHGTLTSTPFGQQFINICLR